MIDIVLDWLGTSSLNISDDVIFIAVVLFSIVILDFIFDFIRFIMYYITRR